MTQAPADPPALSHDTPKSGGWTLRKTMLVVLVVAGFVRLLMLGNLPLTITNDGIDYLVNGGLQIYDFTGDPFVKISAFRTPGYPIIVAAAFWLFGINS